MNKKLLSEIIYHIFYNLGINNQSSRVSIKDNHFQLSNSLETIEENNKACKFNLFSSETKLSDSLFKILYCDFSSQNLQEHCVMIKMQDCPTYACFLTIDGSGYQGEMFTLLESNQWMPASTFLQAAFLAGMEQLKEVLAPWQKCHNFAELLAEMKLFIDYRNSLLEMEDAEEN